jgi:hypothetical protein
MKKRFTGNTSLIVERYMLPPQNRALPAWIGDFLKKFTALFLGEAMIWRSFVISSIFTVPLQTKTDSLMSRISGIRLI